MTQTRTAGAVSMAAALLLAGCGATASGGRSWQGIGLSVRQERVCAGVQDAGECARAIESERWSKLDRFADREGDVLVLELANGKTRRFQDKAGADWLRYSLIDFVRSADAFVVFERSPKRTQHLLISRADGAMTRLDSAPVFSPDGTHFVTTSGDRSASGAIRVYRTSARKIAWSLEPGTWAPGLPRWVDDSTIQIPTNARPPAAGEKVPSALTVTRSTGGFWYAVLSFDGSATGT